MRCDSLRVLKLSSPLFGHHHFMLMFCEALKHSRIIDLSLNNCNINDNSLKLLASAVCDKRITMTTLLLHRNPYSQECLMQFFQALLRNVNVVKLIELEVNAISVLDQLVIKKFNEERSGIACGYPRLNVKVYTSDELFSNFGRRYILDWRSEKSARTLHHY